MSQLELDFQEIAIRVPVVLFALSLHESAHAWVADRCGDPTARLLGRVSLNPLAHLDPIGTLCMIMTRFGWAKPVPVNPFNLRNPRRDDILVSAAGPASNLLMGVVCGLAFRLCWRILHSPWVGQEPGPVLVLLGRLTLEGVWVSCALGVFNLIPLFPLDGSHILKGLLPREMAIRYEALNPVMPLLLLVIVFTGGLGFVLGPPVVFLVSLFAGLPVFHS